MVVFSPPMIYSFKARFMTARLFSQVGKVVRVELHGEDGRLLGRVTIAQGGVLPNIQAVLLRKLRESEGEGDCPWLEPLLRSINAIAAGMRNTG